MSTTKEIHCFCFSCGMEWVSESSKSLCLCDDSRIVYFRPCVEFDERIDAAYQINNSKYLGIEEICAIECNGFPSTIFGLSIPLNTAIIDRCIINFEENEVKTYDGLKLSLDTYYNLRDFGYS